MIKGIIFDMDGTLLDSMDMNFNAIHQAFAEVGFEYTKEMLSEYNAIPIPEISKIIAEKYSIEADPEKIAKRKSEISDKAYFNGEVKLFDGVIETLNNLKKLGFRIGVGTSAHRKHAEAVLSPYANEIEFDAIVALEDVERGKPAPDIFLKCAKEMKVEAKYCMVVEDGINGIIAAKKCGMKSVAITNTTPASKFTEADMIISNIKELNSEFIEKLGGN